MQNVSGRTALGHSQEKLIRLDERVKASNETVLTLIETIKEDRATRQAEMERLWTKINELEKIVTENTLAKNLGRGLLWIVTTSGVAFMFQYFMKG